MFHELQQLDKQLTGEVKTTHLDRLLYASDASIYQEVPLAIARPKNKQDCITILNWAQQNNIPLTPRGAGTSLAGQAIGSALIVDTGRHLQNISKLTGTSIWVDPGVILDQLNEFLAPHHLLFGPDTATSSRCMISGMVGNNSCGEHSIMYGTTRENCLALDVVLSDGTSARFEEITPETLTDKCRQNTLEGRIYNGLCKLIDTYRDTILKASPKKTIIRRNMGYALEHLCNSKPWNPEGSNFNLAPFLCGSEGTLALTTQIKLNLHQQPKARILICIQFDSVIEACHATVKIVRTQPAAVELIDDRILAATKNNITQNKNRFWIKGDPTAVLITEYYADTIEEARIKAGNLEKLLHANNKGLHITLVEGADMARVWALRKAGLGLLMGAVGDKKAVPLIEDAAVTVDDLPHYIKDVQQLMAKHNTPLVYYAHASVGLLHLRPELNLKNKKDFETFIQLGEEISDLVKHYGGSFSAEHGDGRLRAPFLQKMVGDDLYALFGEVKMLFDPKGIFNPGVILNPKDIAEGTKVAQGKAREVAQTYFDWSADEGLLRATEKCNGAGVCRQTNAAAVMCPSYQATLEEEQSTRGRANVFRQFLLQHTPEDAFNQAELKQVFDLCLSCKACKADCPASVDIARLKAEFLQQYYDINGIDRRSKRFAHFSKNAAYAHLAPRLVSALLNTNIVKVQLGIHPKRSIPPFSKKPFSRTRKNPADLGSPKIYLFVDEFSEHLDVPIVRSTIAVCEHFGFHVHTLTGDDSARSSISQGLLKDAKKHAAKLIATLYPLIKAGETVIGIEPSALLGFRDDIPALFPHSPLQQHAQLIGKHLLLFEEWLAQLPPQAPFPDTAAKIRIHGHCHCKALVGTEPLLHAFARFKQVQAEMISSGCCGMAGSFGYKKESYELSMKIGEQALFPAVREATKETLICAHGHSCRHQIYDGTGVRALHPAEICERLLMPTKVR